MDLSYLDLLMPESEEIIEAEGGGGVWVVADASDGQLAATTLEALGVARTLADSLGAYVYTVLLGDGISDLANTLYQAGADGVRIADHPALAPFAVEPYMGVLAGLFEDERPEIVLFGGGSLGDELAPRIAQRLAGGLIEHATSITLDDATRTVRAQIPVYDGEYYAITACIEGIVQVLTLQSGAFSMPFMDSGRHGEPRILAVEPAEPAIRIEGPAQGFEPPATPLGEAPIIVAAGRQCGDIDLVRELAGALGAHLAGDRGARDAGWITADQTIDVRGTQVAPNLYLAIGIRGDTFHNAAIADAKFILAIHPDPTAPIFEMADLCLEAEPSVLLPELLKLLSSA